MHLDVKDIKFTPLFSNGALFYTVNFNAFLIWGFLDKKDIKKFDIRLVVPKYSDNTGVNFTSNYTHEELVKYIKSHPNFCIPKLRKYVISGKTDEYVEISVIKDFKLLSKIATEYDNYLSNGESKKTASDFISNKYRYIKKIQKDKDDVIKYIRKGVYTLTMKDYKITRK